MPIFTAANAKFIITNDDKTRGLSIEYPTDMGLNEMLERINELRDAVLKGIEAEEKKKEEVKE